MKISYNLLFSRTILVRFLERPPAIDINGISRSVEAGFGENLQLYNDNENLIKMGLVIIPEMEIRHDLLKTPGKVCFFYLRIKQ